MVSNRGSNKVQPETDIYHVEQKINFLIKINQYWYVYIYIRLLILWVSLKSIQACCVFKNVIYSAPPDIYTPLHFVIETRANMEIRLWYGIYNTDKINNTGHMFITEQKIRFLLIFSSTISAVTTARSYKWDSTE